MDPLNVTRLAADRLADASGPASLPAEPTLLFAHGYGCNQTMWQEVVAQLPDRDCVLFDWPGAGLSDPSSYDPQRHATLEGYADDLLALIDRLDLRNLVCVGHSVGGSVAMLAAVRRPEVFKGIVLVAPSPCFFNDDPYVGGFERDQLEQLVQGLADGHAAWSRSIAPVVVGTPDRPDAVERIAESFCAIDPTIALRWAKATFYSDLRDIVPKVTVPTLILQCTDDALVPLAVGSWLQSNLPAAHLVQLEATGHCPHLTQPREVAEHVRQHTFA